MTQQCCLALPAVRSIPQHSWWRRCEWHDTGSRHSTLEEPSRCVLWLCRKANMQVLDANRNLLNWSKITKIILWFITKSHMIILTSPLRFYNMEAFQHALKKLIFSISKYNISLKCIKATHSWAGKWVRAPHPLWVSVVCMVLHPSVTSIEDPDGKAWCNQLISHGELSKYQNLKRAYATSRNTDML